MTTLNLMPARLRERNVLRRRRARWILGISIYSGAAAAGGVSFALASGPEHWRINSDEGRIATRVAAGEDALAAVHTQLTDHRRRLIASETVGVHPEWSLLLQAIANSRGDDVVLDSIDLKTREAAPQPAPSPRSADAATAAPKPRILEHYTLTLRGFALSQPDVMKFVRRLEQLGPLKEVRLLQTSAAQHRGLSAFAFTVDCQLREQGDVDSPEAQQ